MGMSNEHKNTSDEVAGKNIDDYSITIPAKGYRVAAWTPERDGKGTPTQVHLVIELDGGPEIDGIAAMQLKTPRAVDELIGDLQRYRDQVWPLGFVAGEQGESD